MIDTKEDKANRIINYFFKKYGEARTEVILHKIAPGFDKMTEETLIKVGEKWHWFNLMMKQKCTFEECHKALKEMGYE